MKRSKIVVVDDDVVTLKILTTILNDFGFQVRVASDSATGQHLVDHEQPDLVVLDVDMPKKSGLELLWDMRHNPATQNIPVLMLTAESKSQTGGLAFEMGANAYFKKPFNHVDLRNKVEELIRNTPH